MENIKQMSIENMVTKWLLELANQQYNGRLDIMGTRINYYNSGLIDYTPQYEIINI